MGIQEFFLCIALGGLAFMALVAVGFALWRGAKSLPKGMVGAIVVMGIVCGLYGFTTGE